MRRTDFLVPFRLIPTRSPVAILAAAVTLAAPVAPLSFAQQAVRVEMGLINDMNMDAQGKAINKQLQGQLAVELGFIRRTCRPTPEQKKQIVAVAQKCLGVVADANRNAQPVQMGGGFIVRNGRIQERTGPVSLKEELKKELRPILDKDQWERFQTEYDQREAFRTEVMVDQVMACYERRLTLTPEQQKDIRESLKSDWNPSEHANFDTLRNNPQFLPQLPDKLVLPFLEKDQQTVYRAAPKLHLEQQFGGNEPVWFQEGFWELAE